MSTQEYFKLNAEEIFEDVIKLEKEKFVSIEGIEFIVRPNVYPSDKFRTTSFVLKNIQPYLKDKTVCDMGCGLGVVGQYALEHGAKRVVQADINPYAIENAEANRELHKGLNKETSIYQSDCFDNVPKQIFDIIVWNMPFHTEPMVIKNPLEHAFHDPYFQSLKKFLNQLPDYSHENTLTFIAFSNKGDIEGIEKIFDSSNLNWELWKVINADQAYDNRIYLIK
ncbi:MAG: methyltransferase [Chlamydiae bacterium]|nr:methyltransferase [Chlamydiota bacterium]